ncbi:MAG TPA: electron transfer flavoprotein subunit alpha/FixB family protein [Ignavibacteria bacterium]|nr:electron transfer flavoprotein subunit alpha/FixB family protein [Ignavibacteria bacterium]HMR39932.1 electron transfer flavoprotein subunit alpha/FixB family protein [Ignavibacteria bacterium]
MSNKILAFIESKDGKFKNSAFEVITEALKIAEDSGSELEVLTIGSGLESEINELSVYGAKKIKIVDLNILNKKYDGGEIKYSPSAYAKVISEIAKNAEANIIILSATSLGKDLVGRIAVKTDSAVFNDCIDIKLSDGKLTASRPVYAGKSIIDINSSSEKIVMTLRPNVFKPEKTENSSIETENTDIENLGISGSDFSTVVTDVIVSNEKLDVAEADKIVSGGRGLRGPENFNLIEDLAGSIGAATGASRAVVDAGWRPHSEQVGQTGKTVSPSLYIACGISGAIQHLAGMSSSKCIVAINKDKDAPIFQIADYGIVGDVFDIVPSLTEEFKKVLSN